MSESRGTSIDTGAGLRLTTRLVQADLHRLNNAVALLRKRRTLDEFPSVAMQVMKDLVPGISYSYTEVNLKRNRAWGVMDPPDSMPTAQLISVMDSLFHEHPLISNFSRTRDSNTLRISDFLSASTYHRMALYAEFYQFLDTEDQMAIQLSGGPEHVIGLVVNRDRRNFSERDRTVFDLLRDHVAEGFRGAEAFTAARNSAELDGKHAVWISSRGTVTHSTPGAQTLLDEYFGHERVPGTGLPEQILNWAANQQRQQRLRELDRCRRSFSAYGPRGRLLVRFLSGPAGESDLLLVEERRYAVLDEQLRVLGLSGRERDVVRLVVKGKTSGEIAGILDIRQRTVEKHLANIYSKVGVTSRASLVARVLQSS